MGRSKRKKAVNITIPIEEGNKYHDGDDTDLPAATPDKALSLKVEALKGAFPAESQGDVFSSTAKIRKALGRLHTDLRDVWIHRFCGPTPETAH